MPTSGAACHGRDAVTTNARSRPMTKSAAFRRVTALLGLLALTVVIAATPLGVADAAGHDTGPKPTVVLVHGAWADASGWNAVADQLQRRGYQVIAPAIPLRSVSNDAQYLASVLATISGPIVLVGHSYGGAIITNAAAGNPNVNAL